MKRIVLIIILLIVFYEVKAEGINMLLIENKINVLKLHPLPWTTPAFSNFKYPIKTLTAAEYEAKKPSDSLPFDVGFVEADGTINVSEPATDSQKAVFKDINKAAVYYLCQGYMYFCYQTKGLPLLFKVGFPAYEAGISPTDVTVQEAINKYGGLFASFDLLNNPTTFTANNGFAVAYAFGEFMNIFKNWGWSDVLTANTSGFEVASYWVNVNSVQGLLADFNRYISSRFLESDEKLRVKLYLESDHFKIYTREADALNYPTFTETLESAYTEYAANFKIEPREKLSFFSLPECIDAAIEGVPCAGRLTGGTAWSSGLHSTCATSVDQLHLFHPMNRHELAHAFQAMLYIRRPTAWLMEGFASYVGDFPASMQYYTTSRQQGITALDNAVQLFGHRPTYKETEIYPSNPYYDYYFMGMLFVDFIYRKGGWEAVRNVQIDDLEGYKKMGYTTSQEFLDDFYYDFDVRVLKKNVVSLTTPEISTDITNPAVEIKWAPLKSDVKLNVSVSTDNGAQWTSVVTNTLSTACSWNAGTFTGKFLLKFTAPNNLNLESVFGPFTLIDPEKPFVKYPNGSEYLIAGDTASISWGTTNIPEYKIEFTPDNGANWSTVRSAVPSSQKFKWIVPNSISENCKIRITSTTNSSKFDENDAVFRILNNNPVGGPYLYDSHTVVLLHLDNDLKNRSWLSGDANGSIQNLKMDANPVTDMGRCLNMTSSITIPHNANLNLSGDWTIEAWVKFNSFASNSYMTLVTKPGDADSYQSNYSLELNPWWNNVFHGFYFSKIDSRIGCSVFSPTVNEWFHVAFIRDTKNSEIRIVVHDKNRKQVSTNSTKYTGSENLLNTRDLIIGSGIDGCVDEVRISNVVRSFIATNTDDILTTDVFTIFPNPSNGVFTVSRNRHDQTYSIRIFDINSKLVYERTHLFENETIYLNNHSKGIYFVQVIDDKQIETQKIIIR